LAGSSVSSLGTRVSTIAFPMLVLYLTDSPVDAGWAVFAVTVPSMLVYLPAGVLVDRWRPRRTMLISEACRGLAIGAIVGLLLLGRLSLPLLLSLAIAEEILEVFSALAEKRFVGVLVDQKNTPRAVVQMEARTHLMVLAGRPLGGLLFAFGPIFPFAADAFSFVVSVIGLVAAGPQPEGRQVKVVGRSLKELRQVGQLMPRAYKRAYWGSLWCDLRDSVRWLRENKFLRIMILLSSGTTFICQSLIIVFITDAHLRLSSAFAIGVALGASGAGGVLGSVYASRMPSPAARRWTESRRLVWITGILALITSAVFWTNPPVPFMAFVMATLGFTGAMGNVEFTSYLMGPAAGDMLARVGSISRLMSYSAAALGPAFGGLMAQECGIRAAISALAVLMAILVIFSLRMPFGLKAGESGAALPAAGPVVAAIPVADPVGSGR
jgi:MFS family permease